MREAAGPVGPLSRVIWRPNPGGQEAFCRDDVSRFPAGVAGLRGGKTWGGARKAVRLARLNHTAGLLVAETYPQAREIMVPEFMRGCREAGIPAVWRPSEPCILLDLRDDRDSTHGGRVIVYVRSAEKAERIAGFEVGWGWGDEVGRWPYYPTDPTRDPWTQCIARMSDDRARLSQFIVTGTHEGFGTRLYDDWERGGGKPGHVLHRWSTRHNAGNLQGGYIESLQASYDPRLLEQYLEGMAVDLAAGLTYYAYGGHNSGHPVYREDRPLWWALDFNLAPMCSVVAQPTEDPPGGDLEIIGEIVQPRSANTEDLCQAFISAYSGHRGRVVVYGDASGNAGDTRSRTDDWQMVERALRVAFGDRLILAVPRSNPPVRERVARVNALCRDGLGRVRLRLDPTVCSYLHRDLSRVAWRTPDQIDKRDSSLTHASDALGYLVHVCYPPETRMIGGAGEGTPAAVAIAPKRGRVNPVTPGSRITP